MSKVRRKVRSSNAKTPLTWIVLGGGALVLVAVVAAIVWNGQKSSGAAAPTAVVPEGLPYKGAADAPVTLVVYSDYQCSHCRDFALETAPLIEQAYVATGKVKLVSHYYALWDESLPFVAAAMCAAEQGKYWDFDHTLFANQASLEVNTLPVLARQAGLDMEAFNKCQQSGAYLARAKSYRDQGRAAGVNSTPTFFINGTRFLLRASPEPFEQFRQEIERVLASSQ